MAAADTRVTAPPPSQSSPQTRSVAVYRSEQVTDLYVYIGADATLDVLPAELRARFVRNVLVMTLELTPQQKLARAVAQNVLTQIDRVGFYLQMPPEVRLFNSAGRLT